MRWTALVTVSATLAAVTLAAGLTRAAAIPASQQVNLTGPGFTVQFTQTPFSMQVLNASGQTVLAQVPYSGAPQLATDVPALPLGVNPSGVPFPHRYAPFTFTVGRTSTNAFPATFWEGNLFFAANGGVQYAANGVISSSQVPDGLALTLSTDDPSGRTLALTLTTHAGLLDVAVVPSSSTGIVAMGDSFLSTRSERFAGFGGMHSGLDQHGARFPNWVQEENFSTGPLQPVTSLLFFQSGGRRYMFPNGPHAEYYVQPQFVSTAGYGFLLNQSDLADWHLDSDRPDGWLVESAASHLNYHVAVGNPGQVISTLTAVTGRHRVPPAWALGAQLDRRINSGQNAASYAATISNDLAVIVANKLPITGYRIEAWHILDPAVLSQLISQFNAQGIHVLVYIRGYVSTDLLGTNDPAQFTYAVAHGLVATNAKGQPYIFDSPTKILGGRAAVIDFTNPAGKAYFESTVTAALNTGADGFMSDFGEQVLPDMHFANGQTGATMHNEYPVLYQQAVREAVDAFQQAHPGRQIWFYNRSGYTGSTGYEGGNFPGDETSGYSPGSGLQALTSDMLNRGLAGAYGYTTDIGGYEDLLTGTTDKELFLRWAEWAALSPIFRVHNNQFAGTQMPWYYGAGALTTYTQLAQLRRRAAPLIGATWANAYSSGTPLTRPVWLVAPDDGRAWAADQEWLLGPDVLVAPVVTNGATQRSVYIPPGCWSRQDSPGSYTGPSQVAIAAPLNDLPYFFRCNTNPF
ncbi:TIM-barrel domain-containing protein [Mycobacterium sp.]|uniref:TIM-barrel domain-containing protein n=1 Tax=Mycobacterium sp. TaxID=1785 RepID=UPI0031D2E778